MIRKLFLIAIASGVGFSANARPDKEVLICRSGPSSGVTIELDSTSYDKNSGYTDAVRASIWHFFSGVSNMTCVSEIQFDSYDIQCTGYYGFSQPTEIKVKGTGTDIIAKWTTSKGYGNVKMTTPCVIEEATE